MNADNTVISQLQGPFLDQDSRNRPASLVQLGLHDRAARLLVGVRLEVHHVGLEKYHFQQLFQVETFLCRNFHHGGVATPFFRHQAMLGQFLLHPLRLGVGLVDLVDGDDNRHPCCLGMVYRLPGLGHDPVVRRHHEDDDIGNLGSASPHGGERLVTRSVEEGNLASIELHVIGTDVLGNPSSFTGNDVSLADGVQKRGFAVIDVPHDGNHR